MKKEVVCLNVGVLHSLVSDIASWYITVAVFAQLKTSSKVIDCFHLTYKISDLGKFSERSLLYCVCGINVDRIQCVCSVLLLTLQRFRVSTWFRFRGHERP